MRRRNFRQAEYDEAPVRATPPAPRQEVVQPSIVVTSKPAHPTKGYCRWCEKYIGRGKASHEKYCDAQLTADGARVTNEYTGEPKIEDR